ncbi:MAG: radical SAM protein [Thermodesulfobacteriota bacterium]|nr:radical SAM protein [Thermodesulfobacteriota bacterium]
MKILLIYPYWLEARVHTEDVVNAPIGVYYIGAVLKEEGYDVEILNWHDMNGMARKIREILEDKKPDVIGFSILQANRFGGLEIARIAKELNPDVKIVFGGVSATFLWKHFLKNFPEVDFVVLGEGEYTFLNLVRCIEKGEYERLKDIGGLAFREDGKLVKTKESELITNLDELPNPAKYFTYQHLSLTRGCPGKCTFCGSPMFWGPKVRSHSADYFVDQLEAQYKRGISFFYVSDDTFTMNKKRVIEVCEKILEKGLQINWAAISRVNYVNEEVLSWMRRAGCIQISFGVESGSEKIRQVLNKKITAEQIKSAFAAAMKYGILARAYFIYGCPGENKRTIQDTIDLIREIKPLVINFFVLSLFPGTALYRDFQKKARVPDDVWLKPIEDIKYFETDPKLSEEMVFSFGQKIKTAYYESLPAFVDAIELVDEKEFYPLHSDFCARLGMTFDQGDYARNEAVPEKQRLAEDLYKKALAYFPDSTAYLGLGMILQRKRQYKESIGLLSEGVSHFPDNERLSLCLAVSYMNLGDFEMALSHLLKFQDSKQAVHFAAICHKALGNFDSERALLEKLQSMP